MFLFSFLRSFYTPESGSVLKAIFNIHIYVSLAFIPMIPFKRYESFFYDKSKKYYYLIVASGVLLILRDLGKGEIFTLFGNPLVGPAFLLPLFISFGMKKDSLYWVNKILIYSVFLGVLIEIMKLGFGVKIGNSFLLSTYFAIINFNYVNRKSKLLIIVANILSIFHFYEHDYRADLLKAVVAVLIVVFLQLKFYRVRKVYKLLIIVLLLSPIYPIYNWIVYEKSIFTEVFRENSNLDRKLFADTRTFLYMELLDDLVKTDSYLFGKGALGRYHSDYFSKYRGLDGDSDDRVNVEVGVLQYLLKGGAFHLVLFLLIFYSGISYSSSKGNSLYLKSLGLLLVSFLLISFIENIPSYSLKGSFIWIFLGISLSKNYVKLSDKDIKYLIQKGKVVS